MISRLLRNTVWKNFRECVERGYGVDWKGREEFSNTVNWGGGMKDEVHCVLRCEALTDWRK